MDETDAGDRRNGDTPTGGDEVVATAPAPEAAPETADLTVTGAGLRPTAAAGEDQPAPRPIDLVASSAPPVRRALLAIAAGIAGLLLARWLWGKWSHHLT